MLGRAVGLISMFPALWKTYSTHYTVRSTGLLSSPSTACASFPPYSRLVNNVRPEPEILLFACTVIIFETCHGIFPASSEHLNTRVVSGATADKHQGDSVVCRGSLVSGGTSSNIVRQLYTADAPFAQTHSCFYFSCDVTVAKQQQAATTEGEPA